MGFRNDGLRAIAFATLVALASVSVQIAPVEAADPVPTPTTVDPTPTAVIQTTPDPTPTPTTVTPTAVTPTTVTPITVTPITVTPTAADPTPTTTPLASVQVTIAATTLVPVARASLAARVVRIALGQRHKRYVFGAVGPWAFDCSGLVRYAYRIAGVSRHLGGGNSARAMYAWGRMHRLTSRSQPHLGDVVVYGGGAHVAIYIGHGRVISALNPRKGIQITGLHALRGAFTTFIHTHL